jgi:methionine-R-sulfoxide reductase
MKRDMKTLFIVLGLIISLPLVSACQQKPTKKMEQNSKYNKLNDYEKKVILEKATDRPYTGEYTDNKKTGTYICRQCNNPLYESKDKFDSHCGWPSFDDEIKGSVKQIPDADGMRTEIVCNNCQGHLGHVFMGEGFTNKNTRHCVNSTSMVFVEVGKELPAVIK